MKVGFFNRHDFDIELIEFEKEVRPSIDEPEIVDRLVRNRVDILENFLVTKFMLALGDISPTILPDYSRDLNPEAFKLEKIYIFFISGENAIFVLKMVIFDLMDILYIIYIHGYL